MVSGTPRATITCRSCGTEIAANALICYRCGAPTAAAAASAPRTRPNPTRRTVIRALVLFVVALVLVRVVACGSLL
jgi:hypothetical protein